MWDYIHFSRYLDGRVSEGYALTAVEKYVYDQVNQCSYQIHEEFEKCYMSGWVWYGTFSHVEVKEEGEENSYDLWLVYL